MGIDGKGDSGVEEVIEGKIGEEEILSRESGEKKTKCG